MLQTNLNELISSLTNLFNVCINFNCHLKQFKKTWTVILRKLKKNDYIKLKMYWFIAFLNTMSKVLELIIIRKLSNITKIYHMLFDV